MTRRERMASSVRSWPAGSNIANQTMINNQDRTLRLHEATIKVVLRLGGLAHKVAHLCKTSVGHRITVDRAAHRRSLSCHGSLLRANR